MTDGLKNIATVEQYRAMTGREKVVTVPTGMLFRVKKLSVMDYIRAGLGDIPNEFSEFVQELNASKPIDNTSETHKKNMEFFTKYMEITIEHGVIEPKVVYQYKKHKRLHDALLFGELDKKDQEYLINVISGKINE